MESARSRQPRCGITRRDGGNFTFPMSQRGALSAPAPGRPSNATRRVTNLEKLRSADGRVGRSGDRVLLVGDSRDNKGCWTTPSAVPWIASGNSGQSRGTTRDATTAAPLLRADSALNVNSRIPPLTMTESFVRESRKTMDRCMSTTAFAAATA